MAISVERKTQQVNWLALAIGLFALMFAAAVVYFFFFAPAPLIERIAAPTTPEAGRVQEILGAGIDAEGVVRELDAFIEDPIPLPTPGELGRPNPFVPF